MKKLLRKIVPDFLKKIIIMIKERSKLRKLFKIDCKRFISYSFGLNNNLDSYEQLEARITKAYHSIEKGLAYQDIRLGFGNEALDNLKSLMDLYRKKGYPLDSECYKTAVSNLNEYIMLHEQNGIDVSDLKKYVVQVGGKSNRDGGVLTLTKERIIQDLNKNFKTFSASRHSVRDFSREPVEISLIEEAIYLAQNTPSACNRQGWKTRVIMNPEFKQIIESNQNGNRGFGSNIDKYILVTTDSQYFAKPRERNQPYIDGGMYAMNLLYSLHYYGIATIPLSASLTDVQEVNIRRALSITQSENFILIIGIGNYIDRFMVPKSARRSPNTINY